MQFLINSFTPISKASNRIIRLIKEKYSVDFELYENITTKLAAFFLPLKKDISVFIEYPYVDKVYRDSYYTYFSTKYKEYKRDCIRVSFFSDKVKEKDIYEEVNISFLEDNFLGYCVLRPTFPDVIGRNLISKKALIFNEFETCIHKENVLINGIKLHVEGFPHSSQDQESITCAETTVWAMMEYFGHKYAEYKPVLPSTIIDKLDEYSDKRMLPSNGLTAEQISYTLKDFGFGTLIYTKTDDQKSFLPILSAYIESGFPTIVTLETEKSEFGHAILMIGREKVSEETLVNAFSKSKSKNIPFFSLIKNYVVQDDNLPPYSIVPLTKPGIHYEVGSPYSRYKITAFVVPLYKKMYMEAQKAREFFDAIFNDVKYGIRTSEKHVFRMYMASSRSFKAHVGKQNKLDDTLKKVFLSVALPRFIWCGEYINKVDASTKTVSSLIILDATEAGENWEDSFIFAAHKKKSLFYTAVDHTYKLIPLDLPFEGFLMYEHNLN